MIEPEDRICSVLIPDKVIYGETEPPMVSMKYLNKYHDFLKNVLPSGILFTASDAFEWWGESEKKSSLELSVDDVFSLVSFEEIHEERGIIVRVRREIDGSLFDLPLDSLKTLKTSNPGTQELEDYSYWFVNFC